MKKQILFCGAVLTAFVLSGCASVGNESLRKETEGSVAQKIVQGKTTKAEIKALFGSPTKTTFTDGGLEVWNYDFANVSADAISYVPIVNLFGASASGKKKELVVMYDTNNVVKRFSMSESDVTRKTGLFNN
jgi:outer membrane protein assembly factor BamE (lipoprotein component of BamABCDE complex)